MITSAAASTSSESPAIPASAAAARVARTCVRVLLTVLLLLPVYAFLSRESGVAARVAVIALFCATLVRPANGLLLGSAFAPMSSIISGVLGSHSWMLEPFLFAFLSGWVLGDTFRGEPLLDGETRPVVVPALVLAAVVTASMIVLLGVEQVFRDYPWPFYRVVLAHLGTDFAYGTALPGFAAGARMLESIALFLAVVALCRRQPGLSRRVAAMTAAGGAAVAVLNLERLAEVCLRSPGTFRVLLVHPRNIRITAVFTDINAVGSYLALMLLVIVGLMAVARRARWVWAGAAVATVVALWFSGSRTAPIAVVVSGGLVFFWNSRGSTSAPLLRRLAMIALALVALTALDWFAAGYATRYDVGRAVLDRSEFSLAAVRAFKDHPIFGVGVGRFWSESARYILDPHLRVLAPQENAHNNFLQILSELGCAGFVPFVWLLAVVGSRACRVRGDLIMAGLSSGLLAFLLTCMAGHPLLTTEVALGFWLVLALIVAHWRDMAVPGPVVPARAWPWTRIVLAGTITCLAVSIPIRVHDRIENGSDLGGATLGFSGWQSDPDGPMHRTMTGRGRFYVPGSTCEIRLGLRVDPAEKARQAEVELRIDGHVANRVRVIASSWTDVKVLLRVDARKRFRQVDLETPERGDIKVMTGRPALEYCRGDGF